MRTKRFIIETIIFAVLVFALAALCVHLVIVTG